MNQNGLYDFSIRHRTFHDCIHWAVLHQRNYSVSRKSKMISLVLGATCLLPDRSIPVPLTDKHTERSDYALNIWIQKGTYAAKSRATRTHYNTQLKKRRKYCNDISLHGFNEVIIAAVTLKINRSDLKATITVTNTYGYYIAKINVKSPGIHSTISPQLTKGHIISLEEDSWTKQKTHTGN